MAKSLILGGAASNVRYWHKADIVAALIDVCFRGNSGHWGMSALPPKADIGTRSWNVRFVPKADMALIYLALPRLGRATAKSPADLAGHFSVAIPVSLFADRA